MVRLFEIIFYNNLLNVQVTGSGRVQLSGQMTNDLFGAEESRVACIIECHHDDGARKTSGENGKLNPCLPVVSSATYFDRWNSSRVRYSFG